MRLADGQSLLLKTYLRAANVAQGGEILTVTNRDYFFMSKDELAKAGLGERNPGVFMLEPVGRNTAPAVAMAALHVAEKHGRDALLLVLAADHLIKDQPAFARAVGDAASLAAQDYLVTFGIVPDAPETGFGYIESGEALGAGKVVKRFVEKPSLEKAREYLAPAISCGIRACSASRPARCLTNWRGMLPTCSRPRKPAGPRCRKWHPP